MSSRVISTGATLSRRSGISNAILTRSNDKNWRRGATAHVNTANTTNTPSGPSAGEVNLSIVLGLLVFVFTFAFTNRVIMASTTKRTDFEAIFPSLAQDILAHAKKYNLPANALEWFEKVSAPPLRNDTTLNRGRQLTLRNSSL